MSVNCAGMQTVIQLTSVYYEGSVSQNRGLALAEPWAQSLRTDAKGMIDTVGRVIG